MPRGRAKVKKITPSSSEDTDVLNDMFAQMTGTENADPEIIIPKLARIQTLLNKFTKLYKLLLSFDEFISQFAEHKDEFDDISKFIQKIETLTGDSTVSTENLKKSSVDQVNALYKKLKTTPEVQAIIVTSSNLGKHKKYLGDRDNLGDDFIKREPGISLTPLKFTKLDLKILWSSGKLTGMAKKYILSIISHTYQIGHEMYQIITSPDIDIKKFSKVLIDNIDKMKKQIPRCNKAFDIIANSVNMLENKFDGYYKTSVEAENPSIIVESFIIDVSMSQKSNASITAQFRKIIMFMKRQSANNKDPRVAKLFKILNNQFSMMHQQTGEEVSEPDGDDVPEPDGDDVPEPDGDDVPEPDGDMTEPDGDMTEPDGDMTEVLGGLVKMMTEACEPVADAAEPDADAAEPDADEPVADADEPVAEPAEPAEPVAVVDADSDEPDADAV
jgi:hypothetical protein